MFFVSGPITTTAANWPAAGQYFGGHHMGHHLFHQHGGGGPHMHVGSQSFGGHAGAPAQPTVRTTTVAVDVEAAEVEYEGGVTTTTTAPPVNVAAEVNTWSHLAPNSAPSRFNPQPTPSHFNRHAPPSHFDPQPSLTHFNPQQLPPSHFNTQSRPSNFNAQSSPSHPNAPHHFDPQLSPTNVAPRPPPTNVAPLPSPSHVISNSWPANEFPPDFAKKLSDFIAKWRRRPVAPTAPNVQPTKHLIPARRKLPVIGPNPLYLGRRLDRIAPVRRIPAFSGDPQILRRLVVRINPNARNVRLRHFRR